MAHTDPKALVADIFYSALRSVDPYELVKTRTAGLRTGFHRGGYQRLLIIGFGKAACPMAKAAEEGLAGLIGKGVIITKYGHCERYRPGTVRIIEAGHPVPDENGMKGAGEIIRLLKEADEHTMVVCLISGGGSALLVSPAPGITIDEKQRITGELLRSGAEIDELNAVRKHISEVKGGRLARLAYPSKVVSLILSDVVGDSLDVIASGPTSPDPTTFSDALSVLEKYGLIDKAPKSILKVLRDGEKGSVPETPKEGDMVFEKVENLIIGSNRSALTAAKEKARDLGLEAIVISDQMRGEAGEAAKWLAERAVSEKSGSGARRKPLCLISGGETTVAVRGRGLGGRNMELALAFAIKTDGIDGITLLSAGTDGTDGPTDAAGAVVCGGTFKKAREAGLDPLAYLRNNDSYNFFSKAGGLFVTGPTGTNVMDIQIVVID
jgi:glycerate 2-kinase